MEAVVNVKMTAGEFDTLRAALENEADALRESARSESRPKEKHEVRQTEGKVRDLLAKLR